MKSRRRESSVRFVELVGRAKRGSGGKERSKRGGIEEKKKKIDKEPGYRGTSSRFPASAGNRRRTMKSRENDISLRTTSFDER